MRCLGNGVADGPGGYVGEVLFGVQAVPDRRIGGLIEVMGTLAGPIHPGEWEVGPATDDVDVRTRVHETANW